MPVGAVRQQVGPLLARQVAARGTAREALPRRYVGGPLDRVLEHDDEQPAVRLEEPQRDRSRKRAERLAEALAGTEVPDADRVVGCADGEPSPVGREREQEDV